MGDEPVKFVDNIGLVEAMKSDFANRLADVEAKAERYRLALEDCRRILEDGRSWNSIGPSWIHTIIAEALK